MWCQRLMEVFHKWNYQVVVGSISARRTRFSFCASSQNTEAESSSDAVIRSKAVDYPSIIRE